MEAGTSSNTTTSEATDERTEAKELTESKIENILLNIQYIEDDQEEVISIMSQSEIDEMIQSFYTTANEYGSAIDGGNNTVAKNKNEASGGAADTIEHDELFRNAVPNPNVVFSGTTILDREGRVGNFNQTELNIGVPQTLNAAEDGMDTPPEFTVITARRPVRHVNRFSRWTQGVLVLPTTTVQKCIYILCCCISCAVVGAIVYLATRK